ncbi:threonylcarbamoyl-AMP synthase [Candidatus Woesebacteria bacterium RIFCSPHIGHO2_01_FULL_44_10]|uniref:L-threonylcarbamoyladenylate synthase n=1 Tax=Candidatus Woesebacteria bacterium RIFCSPLOWO2_01_FULL_44_14 TaxID=1802525 RepID=A0A1F8C1S6_9BACT|nr:MAG: threonylcarbamoyl-AMP synthase [Candidatus Woesebacteria bacterium RIFCSPHIGHO2_01_FULL_44_10]OGM54111.1 MAG: threonylcarbamoyl-AMP synthase [Candidatus Woesebacteria bacterium RIFCSPHIGHO2_12_FULL_44_11]OGM70212.1 MAG: threonylcarbamoyl-AMP synthase [Candidatus Woesebacteria bacterium RIFCSPLOWO2_01_FULL_44_14]
MDTVQSLKQGKIGVLPTDTLYGIHARALDRVAVEKVYTIRRRQPNKLFIILIASIDDLKKFKIEMDDHTQGFLEKHWPASLSVVLPCPHDEFKYLHRTTKTLAFRIPKKTNLLAILKQTGPLISTTVNPEGQDPAKTISQAKVYFGNQLDFYVDEGYLDNPPSTLIKFESGRPAVLRQGTVKI